MIDAIVLIGDANHLQKGPIMRLPLALAAAFFIALLAGPAAAQNSHANGHATTHGQGANHGGGKPATTPAADAKTPPGHATGNPHKAPTTTTAATTAATTAVITAKTPIAGHTANPQLAARLLQLLPAGSTIETASAGFKNWGQFVAAVHVSHNLGIPFASLKARMTGANPMSLGQAIQALHPMPASTTAAGTTTSTKSTTTTKTKVRNEVEKAESEAAEDLREAAEHAREAAEEAREAANEPHK